MAFTKLDLYNPEWLELVFDNKNKDYGAYDLRKHYAGYLLKSMAIAFFSVAALYAGYAVLKPQPEAVIITAFSPGIPLPPKLKEDKAVVPPKVATSRARLEVNTIKYPSMVPAEDKNATNPPEITELKGAVTGSETKKGDDTGIDVNIPEEGGGTNMSAATEHKDDVLDRATVEVEPEPYGGAQAWAKFLQKNIHYPPQATENGVQGKVFLSFIVETDGHLSNIKVERGVGSGLDEEALRVLKIAPAWKPGIQNGHKVRVQYNIPINFVMSDQE